MRICFSTLACPTWTLSQVVEIAVRSGYDGIELRFVEGEDSLWKLPVFEGAALAASANGRRHGLSITHVGTAVGFIPLDPQERALGRRRTIWRNWRRSGRTGIRVWRQEQRRGSRITRGWIAEGIRNLEEKRETAEWSLVGTTGFRVIGGEHCK
jgi:hypothetical protein